MPTELFTKMKKAMQDTAAGLYAAVSNKPWSGAASNYSSTEAYCAACLVDENTGSGPKVESKCHLPVKEPGGAINRNAVHAAAARLNQTQMSPASKASAAAKLRGLYKTLGEQPPDALKG